MITLYLIADNKASPSSLSSAVSEPAIVSNVYDTTSYNLFVNTNKLFKESDTSTEYDRKHISLENKLKIISLPLRWKNFNYKPYSRRFKKQVVNIPSSPSVNIEYEMNMYFSILNNFSNYKIISIDGVNGVGKSTITHVTNRTYAKINLLHPEITKGQDYNIRPLHAIEYIMADRKNTAPTVWDRDRFSNLRFYFIHYLMYQFKDEEMTLDDGCMLRVYEKLNSLAITIGLVNILSFLETIYESVPTIILLNNNLKRVGHMLINRGGKNDIFNAKFVNYQYAQHYVYSYFAKILEHPIIDLSYTFDKFGLSVPQTHEEILKRITCKTEMPNIEDQTAEAVADVDDSIDDNDDEGYISARALQNFCKNHDDCLMYNFSKK